MKILMVNKFLYPAGGTETYMFKLGSQLQAMGNEVEYFGMYHDDNCVGNDENMYTENMDFHNSGALKKIKLSIKTVYSKEARKKMRKVLDSFQPDVVHLNNFNFQLTPSIIYAVHDYEKKNNRKVKIIYTAHDYQLVCPNHMMRNPKSSENCDKCKYGDYKNCTKGRCIHSSLLKSALGSIEGYLYKSLNTYSFIDKVICCSEFMENQIKCNSALKDKTVVLHNFADKEPNESAEKKNYVLYFGRFSEEKGIKTLCQSAEKLKNIRFVFAGSGELSETVNSMPNIDNVGFKTGKELNELIENAMFSVYPSEWYENCPFSIIESITLKTPVIASDIGGIPELIENNVNGLLFESGNCNDLSDKIEYLWNNKELCKKMSENCLKNNFLSLDEYAQEYLKIVGDII
ncbi:MAG: glycosyltransferase family 4 protein [Eubacterium sp.]